MDCIEIFVWANSNARSNLEPVMSRTGDTPMADATAGSGIAVRGALAPAHADILTPAALDLLAELHRRFEPDRRALLAARQARQARFDAGELPGFRPDTRALREADWKVAPIPPALQ